MCLFFVCCSIVNVCTVCRFLTEEAGQMKGDRRDWMGLTRTIAKEETIAITGKGRHMTILEKELGNPNPCKFYLLLLHVYVCNPIGQDPNLHPNLPAVVW